MFISAGTEDIIVHFRGHSVHYYLFQWEQCISGGIVLGDMLSSIISSDSVWCYYFQGALLEALLYSVGTVCGVTVLRGHSVLQCYIWGNSVWQYYRGQTFRDIWAKNSAVMSVAERSLHDLGRMENKRKDNDSNQRRHHLSVTERKCFFCL